MEPNLLGYGVQAAIGAALVALIRYARRLIRAEAECRTRLTLLSRRLANLEAKHELHHSATVQRLQALSDAVAASRTARPSS